MVSEKSKILGNADAPYINNVLKKEGASFSKMFGEEHFSQGNFFWIFASAHIKPGDYPEGKGITHVNMLRTLEAMYGSAGSQQPNATGGGIADSTIITDVFQTAGPLDAGR